jgi:hypothetical protein
VLEVVEKVEGEQKGGDFQFQWVKHRHFSWWNHSFSTVKSPFLTVESQFCW